MGRRSRRREPSAPEPSVREQSRTKPSRSEQRDAAVRAALEPLGEGERPGAVTVAAVVALALAVANVALYAAGVHVRGGRTGAPGVILFAIVMLVAAAGMWSARYWAVLGFQALLGVSIVIAALGLTVASNVRAVLLSSFIIVAGGLLFYKLIRAMARIQMPERRRPPS